MENFGVNLNRVKQPEPEISGKGSSKKVNKPYVGIISDINPTSTPLSDTLTIREHETPKSKYNPFQNHNKVTVFNNFATGGIIACGIFALMSIFNKK